MVFLQRINAPKNRHSFQQKLLEELDALYRTASYLLGDPCLAEDILQEVVIKALKGEHTFRLEAEFRPWIFAILRNTIADYYRREKCHLCTVSLEDTELPLSTDCCLEKDLINQLLDEEILTALAELPEEMQQVILLADVEDFSYKEITRILNWPLGSVMSRLYRGRQRLRKILHCYAEKEGYQV